MLVLVIELDKVEWVDVWGLNFELAEFQFLVEVTWHLGVSV